MAGNESVKMKAPESLANKEGADVLSSDEWSAVDMIANSYNPWMPAWSWWWTAAQKAQANQKLQKKIQSFEWGLW